MLRFNVRFKRMLELRLFSLMVSAVWLPNVNMFPQYIYTIATARFRQNFYQTVICKIVILWSTSTHIRFLCGLSNHTYSNL